MNEGIDTSNATVNQIMLATAKTIFTEDQLYIFVMYFFGGSTQTQIAADLGVTSQQVCRTISGQVGHHAGLVTKLKEAMKRTGDFDKAVAAIEAGPAPEAPIKGDPVGWFRNCSVVLFGPLTVLLIAHSLADAKGRVLVDDLFRELPRQAVGNALSILRVSGWIQFDGRTVTVLKIPTTKGN
jgi:hypothetical protein